MTRIAFVVADIAGKMIPAHQQVIQPIYDILSQQGLDCKWAHYYTPWGTPWTGEDVATIDYFVTCEPGMTRDEYIPKTFFHTHGLHPIEYAYVTARAPYGNFMPWLGYLSPGSYWIKGISDELKAGGHFPLTGWAKMDAAFAPGARERAISEHKLGDLPYSKTVLYAPCGYWDWASSYDASIKTILNIFEGLAYNLIIKTGAYGMDFKEYETTQTYLSQAPKNIRGLHYDSALTPLYTLADMVITDGSSVAWEAIGLDKPTIQLTNMTDSWTATVPALRECERCFYGNALTEGRPYDEIRAGYKHHPDCRFCGGVEKCDLKELREVIVRNMENPNEHAELRRKWANSVNSPCDGHAGERCATEIRRIAGI